MDDLLHLLATVDEIAADLYGARARIAELEAALQPFARADVAIGDEPGPFRFETVSGHRIIERDDLRRARAALRQTEGQSER